MEIRKAVKKNRHRNDSIEGERAPVKMVVTSQTEREMTWSESGRIVPLQRIKAAMRRGVTMTQCKLHKFLQHNRLIKRMQI